MNYFAHPIFDGITEAEWEAMQALHAFRRRRFARGEVILRTGERTRELGLVCAEAYTSKAVMHGADGAS